MAQALVIINLALQLLISAQAPNVPQSLRDQAISLAHFAIEVAHKSIADASVAPTPSPVPVPIPVPSAPLDIDITPQKPFPPLSILPQPPSTSNSSITVPTSTTITSIPMPVKKIVLTADYSEKARITVRAKYFEDSQEIAAEFVFSAPDELKLEDGHNLHVPERAYNPGKPGTYTVTATTHGISEDISVIVSP